jgi:hypothetical protein
MKTGIFFLALLLVVGMSGSSWAQPGKGQGRGMGPGMQGRLYNPQTEVTVKGEVTGLGTCPSMGPGAARGMSYRSATLKTDQGEVTVHLGPAWFMDEQKLALKKGETLEATGSKITQDGRTIILAREVTVNGKKTTLRNEQGIPAWAGQGRGKGGQGKGGQGRGQGGQGRGMGGQSGQGPGGK